MVQISKTITGHGFDNYTGNDTHSQKRHQSKLFIANIYFQASLDIINYPNYTKIVSHFELSLKHIQQLEIKA